MIGAWLWLGLAWADPTPEALEQEVLVEPAPRVEVAVPTGPEGWIEEAKIRLDRGDYEGGRIAALAALGTEGPHQDEALYLVGVALDLAGDATTAMGTFGDLRARWPESPWADDACFRQARILAATDRFPEALVTLDQVGDPARLPREAQLKVALSRASWTFQAGDTRRGIRLLDAVLAETGPDEVTWYQAEARAALVRAQVATAAKISLDGRTGRVRRALAARAGLIAAAGEQLSRTVDLAEHGFVLEELLLLSSAHEALADAMETSDPHLKPGLLEDYRAALAPEVENQRVKALRYLDLGLEHAERIGWMGPERAALEAARARVTDCIERR